MNEMNIKYLLIILVLVLGLPLQAQYSTRAEAEIYDFVALCDSMECDSCAVYADSWVASLPQDELMAYVQQAEDILYPPLSDCCGRMAYRLLLAGVLQGAADDDIALLRYRYQYDMLCRNNEGQTASDFVYYDLAGEEHRLSQSRGGNTLLIFNDPECDECATLREHIIATGCFAGCAIDSTTTVLLIYPDEPTEAWRRAAGHYPTTWVVGYAEDVSDIYDLRTLPSTYLLDPNRRIVLRDAHLYIYPDETP